MKKVIIAFVFFIVSSANLMAQNNKYEFNGVLTSSEIQIIKKRFNWDTEKTLVVNFRQPLDYCHYNQYINVKLSTWFEDYFSEMKLSDSRIVYVYSEAKLARKRIDNKDYFADENNFLFNKFFNKRKSCYAILIIRSNGEYQQKNGEYSPKDILRMIQNMLN